MPQVTSAVIIKMNTYDYDSNLDSIIKKLFEGPNSSVLLEVSNALQSALMEHQNTPPDVHQNWEAAPFQNGSHYQNPHENALMQYNPQLHQESIPTNGGEVGEMANVSAGQSHNIITLPSHQAVNGDKKKSKGKRTIFNIEQLIALEREYNKSRYIERNRRLQLAKEIQLCERTIKVWFQNQRMKRMKEITEYERNMLIRPDLIQNMPYSRHISVQQLPQY